MQMAWFQRQGRGPRGEQVSPVLQERPPPQPLGQELLLVPRTQELQLQALLPLVGRRGEWVQLRAQLQLA